MDQGFTYLKQDFGINLLKDVPGTLTKPLGSGYVGRDTVMHPFTGISITDKGIAWLSDYIAAMREVIGPEVPLSSDHYGHIDVNSCIRLARAMEKHHLAWMEDMVPWQLGELMKQIRDATDIPILTGEDIYLKEDFIKLIDMGAVDMIHPDLATSGGLLETKKIGDYAMEHGVAMAMHFAGTPISFMANVHCATATENFISLEHHSVDVPWWEDLVTGPEKPIYQQGLRGGPGPARARDRARRGGREGPPQAGHAVLRAHAGVGQRAVLGPAVELSMRTTRRRSWSWPLVALAAPALSHSGRRARRTSGRRRVARATRARRATPGRRSWTCCARRARR